MQKTGSRDTAYVLGINFEVNRSKKDIFSALHKSIGCWCSLDEPYHDKIYNVGIVACIGISETQIIRLF